MRRVQREKAFADGGPGGEISKGIYCASISRRPVRGETTKPDRCRPSVNCASLLGGQVLIEITVQNRAGCSPVAGNGSADLGCVRGESAAGNSRIARHGASLGDSGVRNECRVDDGG